MRLILYPFIIIMAIWLGIAFIPGVRASTGSFFSGIMKGVSGSLYSNGQKIEKTFSFVSNIRNLRKQNDQLSIQISQLEVDKSQISELQIENNLLKKEIGFLADDQAKELIPAKIIERDPTAYLDYMVVDRGSDDGIGQGMAVVAGGVLVGRVKEVTQKTAKIILITSKDSIVQAMLQDSRATGILKGGISGLFLDDINLDSNYKEGENVITSGQGGSLKEGILIGKAVGMQSAASDIFKSISVEPINDLTKLELVFIQK